ncbi:fumarylacetoacetate hydrolase family protein [Brachybacterium sp. EF45031]|uniref:fumarylacetoacetate hydrolase family protein n=1 Tax=Brachybacterium sillae TaxID=2810536 RepID=UPI00217DD4B5|nr:fumarylacetoacetate hydrolase family protein [Brachybacterium sillae]MCS6711733.1 fumarylacetoacetate hydrolase family protein [Brachybacterium sillae]
MKLFAYGPRGAERLAVLHQDTAYALDSLTSAPAVDRSFLEQGGLDRVRTALAQNTLPPLPVEQIDGVRRGAAVAPGKILCIGLNYRDHARETDAGIPTEPIVFMKAPDTVVGPDDEVLIPRGSQRTDWEVELAVVIGSTLRYAASAEEALQAVAGYAISNDVSERDFQLERGGTWDKGKNCETFNPLGPYLVTADEVPDVQDLRLTLAVNGTTRQDGTTADQIFPVGEVVRYLSQFMTLYPGD